MILILQWGIIKVSIIRNILVDIFSISGDTKMETKVASGIDLTNVITKEHEKKWVALSKDNTRVIDYDADLVALDKRVDHTKVTYMKVAPLGVYLSH